MHAGVRDECVDKQCFISYSTIAEGDSCLIAKGEELRPESIIWFEHDRFRKTNAFSSVSEMLLEIQ